jgi:dTDP-4-dehydrorhamnose reductase
MDQPLVWITGAGGLIGSHLLASSQRHAPRWRVRGLTRADLDLADFSAVRKAFARDQPAAVIHCAAMSKSVACQANPQLARQINVDATAALAEVAEDIPFIFLSSDLVFDGRKGGYREEDSPNPLSCYAETKVAAEHVILANPRHTVVRSSLNGGRSPTGDRSFNEELRRACEGGRGLKLFVDEYRSPLPTAVTARALWELLGSGTPGLYHLAGAERLSRWEIGELLFARWGMKPTNVQAGTIKEYDGPPRLPDTSLDYSRIQKLLSFPIPGLGEWLRANPSEPF